MHILFSIFAVYLVGAIVFGVSLNAYSNYKYKHTLDESERLEFSDIAELSLLWFIVVLPVLFLLIPDAHDVHKVAKKNKIENAKRQARQLEIERRKRIIEEVNADIDRFEQTRREDVMSGREIVDIREGEARNRCYICNQTRSPYVRRREYYYEHNSAHNGRLINTISNVPAHEECIMGELNIEDDPQ